MGRPPRAVAPYLSLEEVKRHMKREPRFWIRQRWWILYQVLLTPWSTTQVAHQAAVSPRTVRRVKALYNQSGPGALETPGSYQAAFREADLKWGK